MKKIVGITLGALAIAMFATTASAQMGNMAVYVFPAGYQGLRIQGDVGMGMNDDAKMYGVDKSPMAFGGLLGYGQKMFNINVGAAYLDTKNGELGKPISFGGNVGVTVFRPAESPLAVNVFGGAGYWAVKDTTANSPSAKVLNVPFGVGIAFAPPMTGSVGFQVWAAPRGQYLSEDLQDVGGDKVNFFGFGVSGGVNVDFNMGFGIQAAIDWSTFSEKTVNDNVYPKFSPMYVSAGLHYNFKMPGAM